MEIGDIVQKSAILSDLIAHLLTTSKRQMFPHFLTTNSGSMTTLKLLYKKQIGLSMYLGEAYLLLT